MAHLLGSKNCVESLQRDMEDIHQTVKDVLEKTGPFRVQSWKFPDRLSQDLDVSELLITYTYSKDQDHNRLSHIVLFELVIDRFVFLLQTVSLFLDQLLETKDPSLSSSRPKSRTVGSTMSIGLVVKKFWSKVVNASYSISQIRQKIHVGRTGTASIIIVKEKNDSVSNLESLVVSLREENIFMKENIESLKGTNCSVDHKEKSHRTKNNKKVPTNACVDENGNLPPVEQTQLSKGLTLKENSAEAATQTYDTAFVPCEACSRMQKNLVDVGAAVISLCESQGLPSALSKQKKLLKQSLMAASDVTRWSVEQTRDIERINKHLDHLYQQINPLKEQLDKSKKKCKELEGKIQDMRRTKEDKQLELMKERKTHEENVSKLMDEKNAFISDMENQVRELQGGKEALQEICMKLTKDKDDQKQTADRLEKDNVELKEHLKRQVAETTRLRDVEKEFHIVRKELEDVQKKLNEMEVELGKAHAENKALIKRDKALQSKQESLLSRVDDLDHDCEELQNKIVDLEDEKDRLVENLKSAKDENVALDAKLTRTKDLLQKISEEKDNLEGAVENLKLEINKLTEDIHDKEEKLRLTAEFPVIGANIPDNGNLQHDKDSYRSNINEDACTQTVSESNISDEMEKQIKANNVRIGILEEQNEVLRNSLDKLREFQSEAKKTIPLDRMQLWNPESTWSNAFERNDDFFTKDTGISIFQDRAVVATLKYFGYKTVNDVSLPSKETEKEKFGMELFSKEYVKIKDPNELISKGNLTDSEK